MLSEIIHTQKGNIDCSRSFGEAAKMNLIQQASRIAITKG